MCQRNDSKLTRSVKDCRGNLGSSQDTNSNRSSIRGFLTQDPRVLEILDILSQVANSNATVLILGESGTGKELLAKAIHDESSRREQPFAAVNCGAVVETLQESEFFGYVPGAFTGASRRRIGRFEAADGGTILLDEVSEMKKTLQVQLLRVLQSGEYTPVGSPVNRRCDVRVIAASNRNLGEMVERGEFRGDLYYRLNIISVELPPLRERRGDIALLIDHFVRLFGEVYSKPDVEVDPKVLRLLMNYGYPGNVRELENIVHRTMILSRGGVVTKELLPRQLLDELSPLRSDPPSTFHEAKARAIEKFERAFLTTALQECGGIVTRAARRAGLSERNFYAKLKLYGISGMNFRAS